MSGIDAGLFFAENETTPLHIGSLSVFAGPAPSYGEVVRAVVSRFAPVPRYRQRVRRVPLDLGRPVWVDDPHFQVRHHVRHVAVPAPGGPEELRGIAGRVFGRPLDLTRPLWELWVVEGLAEGGWALISKVHHCLVDGVGGSALMTGLFDLTPDAPPAEAVPASPEAEAAPSGPALVLSGVLDTTAEQVRRLARLPWTVGQATGAAAGRFVGGVPAYARRALAGRGAPSLNGPNSPHRRWSWAETDLAAVRRVGDVLGGTVNDLVLAAVARGFGDLLAGRDALGEETVVRTMVPVSVRSPGERGALTNRVSGVLVALPCGEADPVRRLELIREQTDALKRSRQAAGPDAFVKVLGMAPGVLAVAAHTAARLRQPLVHTVTTNVPGPDIPLYVLGRRLAAIYPYVPLAAGIRVVTGVISYRETLHFGITGDFGAMPDLAVLEGGIRRGFEELSEAASRPVRVSFGR
jgi:WS/DGAT/MGAT family acyltransferase